MKKASILLYVLSGLIVVFMIVALLKEPFSNSLPTPQQRTETVATASAKTNSTTFRNNFGTNITNGQGGSFRKSSFTWTVTKNDGGFNIKSNAVSGSFNVVYSHYDSPNKLHHYNPSGTAYFDNARVKVLMTNGKLEDYAAGNLAGGNFLTIIFSDNNGYIYKLGK